MTNSQKNFPTPTDQKLFDELAQDLVARRNNQLGYPFNQETGLATFHKWLANTGLGDLTIINVGDPYKKDWDMLHTDLFERRAIDFMADACGFGGKHWGVLSNGGTDGNMHGIYFGRKALKAKSNIPPILYVSREAHYSLQKIGDVQNIETRIIKSHPMGTMDVADLHEKLDPSRPALIAIAIGGTFKGAIDNQEEISDVLERKKPIAVYRHLDAALFGGYLPFLDDEKARAILNAQKAGFDSVAISGHKFLSMNEPIGIFICRKETLDNVNENPVEYLNGTIPTLNCSRSGFDALKLYWRISAMGIDGIRAEAEHSLKMADLLLEKLKAKGVPAWKNDYSNTVFFRRPAQSIVSKYALACASDEEFGLLSHIVAMQYLTPEFIDKIVKDI